MVDAIQRVVDRSYNCFDRLIAHCGIKRKRHFSLSYFFCQGEARARIAPGIVAELMNRWIVNAGLDPGLAHQVNEPRSIRIGWEEYGKDVISRFLSRVLEWQAEI